MREKNKNAGLKTSLPFTQRCLFLSNPRSPPRAAVAGDHCRRREPPPLCSFSRTVIARITLIILYFLWFGICFFCSFGQVADPFPFCTFFFACVRTTRLIGFSNVVGFSCPWLSLFFSIFLLMPGSIFFRHRLNTIIGISCIKILSHSKCRCYIVVFLISL